MTALLLILTKSDPALRLVTYYSQHHDSLLTFLKLQKEASLYQEKSFVNHQEQVSDAL
jgi:hypothetical protein